MKNEEDEAFDDLARKQGAWGGGFKAKQAMAADKMQESVQPAQVRHGYDWSRLDAAQKVLCEHMAQIKELEEALAQPAQGPVAYVTGTYGGRFTYDPINRATILPIGMALYAAPPQREWVGLTDEEIRDCLGPEAVCIPPGWSRLTRAIEAKLKDKNNGT